MRWVRHLLTFEARKLLAYRFDFWAFFLGTVITELVLAYYLWDSIYHYKGVSEIGGYSFPTMIVYYMVAPVMMRMIRGHDMGLFSQDIYDGSLTRYLIYPVSCFTFKYTQQLSQVFLTLVQLFLLLGIYLAIFRKPPDVSFTFLGMLQALSLCLMANLIYFYLTALIEAVAFWADNVWSLLVMLRFSMSFLGGGLLPLHLFPDSWQSFLSLFPFRFMVFEPARLFIGRAEPGIWGHAMVVLAGWALGLGLLSRLVWKRGLNQYTGVGI